jgi:GTP cyclohydrolase I
MRELDPLGVAVLIEAEHLCVCMRGIKKHGVKTTTSKLLGVFRDDREVRAEFLNLAR